jgi:hypothetical protein
MTWRSLARTGAPVYLRDLVDVGEVTTARRDQELYDWRDANGNGAAAPSRSQLRCVPADTSANSAKHDQAPVNRRNSCRKI